MFLVMTEQLYSRQQLCALAAIPDDAFAFWIRRGLLKHRNDGEARKHRRFDEREVKIASFLKLVREAGLNIDVMTPLVQQVRSGLDLFDQVAAPLRWAGDVEAASLEDRTITQKTLEYWLSAGKIEPEDAAAFIPAADRAKSLNITVDLNLRSKYWLAYSLERPNPGDVWSAYLSEAGWVLEAKTYEELPADFVIAFSVGAKLASIAWTGPEGSEATLPTAAVGAARQPARKA